MRDDRQTARKIRKVLVVFDASRDGWAALHYGMQKAKENKSELIALHVFPTTLFPDRSGTGPEEEQNARKESLDRLACALRQAGEKEGKGRRRMITGYGRPSKELVVRAKDEDADLVVAPPRFGFLLTRVCCLMDIVAEKVERHRRPRTGAHPRSKIENGRRLAAAPAASESGMNTPGDENCTDTGKDIEYEKEAKIFLGVRKPEASAA